MNRRTRFALLGLSAVILLFLLDTAYEGFRTLRQLDVIEAERDRWQRPSDILQALDLMPGNVAVDFGSGAGYFALKMSSAVGPSGKVLAVDIRKLSLSFLWVRTLRKHQRNIDIVLGERENPHLLPGSADAVLILNTYHELANPAPILHQIFQSLVPGGRLVIVDPMETEHGKFLPAPAEDQLRHQGFHIVSRDDRFIEQLPGAPWWLIVA